MTVHTAMKGDQPGVWDDTSKTFTPVGIGDECPACWARVGHTATEMAQHHPEANRAADAAALPD
jgi:hypothetical protein